MMCTALLVYYQSHDSTIIYGDRTSAPVYRFETQLSRRLPEAIIIGTRKSGTRALLKFLEVNPAVKSAPNEVHFFDRNENYAKGSHWYRSQMPETLESELAIEKSPAYFVTRTVPERVKALNASVKLIVIFRDPVKRLISDFSQLIANKLESVDDNETLWREAELAFEKQILRADGRVDERRQMVKTGMYSTHLERWLAIFRMDQIHFVDGEKLITEPHVELRKLENFLQLEPMIERKHFVFIEKKGFFCLSGKKSLHGIQNLTNRPLCLSKNKGRRHISVSKDLIRKLNDFYAPYNEYLYSMTGINFM